MSIYVYTFRVSQAEGPTEMRELLGAKGPTWPSRPAPAWRLISVVSAGYPLNRHVHLLASACGGPISLMK